MRPALWSAKLLITNARTAFYTFPKTGFQQAALGLHWPGTAVFAATMCRKRLPCGRRGAAVLRPTCVNTERSLHTARGLRSNGMRLRPSSASPAGRLARHFGERGKHVDVRRKMVHINRLECSLPSKEKPYSCPTLVRRSRERRASLAAIPPYPLHAASISFHASSSCPTLNLLPARTSGSRRSLGSSSIFRSNSGSDILMYLRPASTYAAPSESSIGSSPKRSMNRLI